jgi:dTDP-6-deoxy-L-talose 4-dehydrogenase (NAD+)
MKILVTGATGFVGNHVIKALLQQGIEVVATSRNPQKAQQYDWFPQVTYLPSDLAVNPTTNFYEFFGKPTHVIHLAWEGLPNYKDLFHFERNLPHSYRFVKNLVENGVQNITITGTCFEYGMQNGCLAEKLPTNPQNPYGLAKDTLRKYLEMLQQKLPFQLKWIRLFYMYGQGQSEKSILSQLDRALQNQESTFNMSGGEQLRDYLPIEVVANKIIILTLQPVNGIFNCCSGTPISIRKLVENHLATKQQSIRLNLGYYPYPDYEPMAFWGDNTKYNELINNHTR